MRREDTDQVPRGEEAVTFTIQISLEQAALLAAALNHAIASRQPLEVSTEDAEQLAMLHSMLLDLPAAEAECPGVLHGFCL